MNNFIKKGFISLLSLSVLCPVSALTKTESVFSNLNTDGSINKTTVTNHICSKDKDEYIDNSSLDVHENVFLKEADTSIQLKEETIPVWTLNTSSLSYEITMPPMSEGIVFKDNDLYILFESASNKYRFGKILGFDHIYRY